MSSLPLLSAALLASALQLSSPWVAVIDQVNGPWLSLIGEDGRQHEVHRARCEAGLREGMWVNYYPKERRVTRLKGAEHKRYALEVERSLRARLKRLTQSSAP